MTSPKFDELFDGPQRHAWLLPAVLIARGRTGVVCRSACRKMMLPAVWPTCTPGSRPDEPLQGRPCEEEQ